MSLISKLFSKTPTPNAALENLRAVVKENQSDEARVFAITERCDGIQKRYQAALASMQTDPSPAAFAEFDEASADMPKKDFLLASALPAKLACHERCAERLQAPLRTALLALYSAFEAQLAALREQDRRVAESLGIPESQSSATVTISDAMSRAQHWLTLFGQAPLPYEKCKRALAFLDEK